MIQNSTDNTEFKLMVDFNNIISRRTLLTGAAAATLISANAFAAAPISKPPRKAPPWDISEWINGNGGNVDTHKGKVIVVDFFQLWCPGCQKFSIPLMNYWEKQVFTDPVQKGQLAFISIHTVFEGHGYQTPRKLRRIIKEKQINHPVGIETAHICRKPCAAIELGAHQRWPSSI